MFKSPKNIPMHRKVYTPQDIGNYETESPNKKKISKFFIIIIIFLILSGGLVYLFFYSPVFKIKKILVEGVPIENQIFDQLKDKNILLVSSESIKTELNQKYPELNIIDVSRGLPDTLKIKLKERSAEILWQSQGRNYLVDSSGVVYKEGIIENNLPKVQDNKDLAITLDKQVVTENFIKFITSLNSNFNQSTSILIDHYEINETIFQVDAVTNLGWKVLFDTTRSSQYQLNDLARFLKDHQSEVKEYVDVRIEGKVYYK